MNAFADFHVTFNDDGAPPVARFTAAPWRRVSAMAGSWTAYLAAPPASTIVQTREVAPWSVWLIGELVRYDSLSAPADPLGAFVLDLRSGRENPSALDGHFLLFAWNDSTREWHVWTDRFATLHAYHGTHAGRVALGTFHPTVSRGVGASALDWEAIGGFFAMGFFPEDRTQFAEVSILRPATHTILAADGRRASTARYWEWHHDPASAPAFDDAVQEFGVRLGTVLRADAHGGRTAVPISGGLDSRTTFAALCSDPSRLWCYTYGYGERSIETRIGEQVAAARGVPCASFRIGEYLFDRMDDVLAATEGMNDVTQTRQVAVVDALAERSDHVIAAHWGDVWLDDSGAAGNVDGALAKFAKSGRRWLLDVVVAPRLRRSPDDAVREAVARELARIPQIADEDFRLKALKTDTWSFRWTTVGVRAFQLGAFPRLPFYDSRMTDWLCDLPADYLRGRRLQVEWLKRMAPDLAKVTWQAHGANLYLYPYARFLLLPERALKRALRMLARERVLERNWEVQFLSPAGAARLRERLLAPGRRVHEFAPVERIRELLDRFVADPYTEKLGYTVSMLLTFTEWLERYA